MGSTGYEDDEVYENDEEGLSYDPPKPVTAEDVAGLDNLRSQYLIEITMRSDVISHDKRWDITVRFYESSASKSF